MGDSQALAYRGEVEEVVGVSVLKRRRRQRKINTQSEAGVRETREEGQRREGER